MSCDKQLVMLRMAQKLFILTLMQSMLTNISIKAIINMIMRKGKRKRI